MALPKLLWLLVPLIGVGELALQVYFSQRAPDAAAWTALKTELEGLGEPGDLVVVAPEWAEPLARRALGEEWMPLADVARADEAGYAHALEIGLFGRRAPELANFRELRQEALGPFTIRRLENPAPDTALYRFVDQVDPAHLFVAEWNGEAEHPCEFTARAAASSGGLGGHVTYPRQRYRCTGGESNFVGVTVIDDQRYRPRRCIFAHPVANSLLHLRFANVPIGSKLHGYAGLSYLIARDGLGTPVEFAAYVDGKEVGRRLFSDARGFQSFEFALEGSSAARAEVTFEVQSKSVKDREFCFQAEMR